MLFCSVFSCSEKREANEPKSLNVPPALNVDSVYSFIQKQVDFGPRIPNSEAHKAAGKWFEAQFKSYGAKVYVQEFEEYTYNGVKVELKNIIASFNPEKKKRLLLAAHWDTRPFADKDPEDKTALFDGANDGGSGVGILLEVARIIGSVKNPEVGIDIILFDGEDWGDAGEDYGRMTGDKDSWWCLGSQYWGKKTHIPNYTAYYGILLDMVGAKGATFYYDGVSQENAGRILTQVWEIGQQIGYQNYFKMESVLPKGLIDDHVYVNKYARIPMISIMDYRKSQSSFFPGHHTSQDNMEGISKATLKAVGETLLTVIYNE
ncbi:M28 family peptidase [Roseivirga echinicomitans]